ncbi:DsbA family protein [Leptospira idonii]|uniref:Oxidoreductase n=1 Tax=Leptospira idonii TaxID=1193500 RepID=A0A4R9M2M8_9LEPT|nr:thioredoxin domain-containing protein [Leptospira idonii]TGN19987.1 oxidoreductase [Leptospira idonii]
MKVFSLFLILCLLHCYPEPPGEEDLPFLYSEAAIKEALGESGNLRKLTNYAESLSTDLESLKRSEKSKVTDSEISRYASKEKKPKGFGWEDTDAIDRFRESIRIRIVWTKLFSRAGLKAEEKKTLPSLDLLSRLDLTRSPVFGNPKGKAVWVVVEWSDFLCHFCKETHPASEKIRNSHPEEIVWYHKDYPLDPDSEEGIFPLALSRCLWNRSKSLYWKESGNLYKNGQKISEKKLSPYEVCSDEGKLEKYNVLTLSDHREALELGIQSIPRFWVNGRWITGALDEKKWKKILNETK